MFRDSQERSDFLMAFLLEYVQIEYSSVAVGKFSDKAHQHISRYLVGILLFVGKIWQLSRGHLLLLEASFVPDMAQGLIRYHFR